MGCHSSKEAAVEPTPLPQQYRWYCCEDGERAEYADDVRDMLEAAYAAYKSGRGATFPTVAVSGDCEVHLTTMQQAHTRTGIKRDVVCESTGPDRAARWYWCAGGELKYRWYWSAGDERTKYADDVRDRLEAAYAEFKDPEGRGATFPTVAVSCDYEVHLKTMQQAHTRTGMKQDVTRELESDVRTPYVDDVRHRLEAAYAEFKEGRGPSFPTVDVGGEYNVQLKTMQQRHARTGVQREVVREISSHVPKALPPPAAAPPPPVAAPPPAAAPPPPVATTSREASCRKVQAAERVRAARKAGTCAAMAAARLQASERGRLVRTKRAAVTAHILAAARLLEDQNDMVSVHVEPLAEAALDEPTTASEPAEERSDPSLRSGAGERSPAKRGGRLPGFNRAESVRVAEAELRKARDAIKTTPHAPISRALRRLIDEKEAEFTSAARVRRAFEIWAFTACNNFLRWVREARRRQVVVVRVLTRLIKRKLANVFETWCVGLAKRSWLSRSTTTAPDFAASLAATPARSRSRSRSRRPRSAAAAAAMPQDPLRQPSWDFSPTPLDRIVRRTTPAAPYVPAVPKDLSINPLGGSVRVTTSVRSVSPTRRRSPSPTTKLRSPSLSTVITLTTPQRRSPTKSSGGEPKRTPPDAGTSGAALTPALPAGITQALADAAEEKVRPQSAAPPQSRSRLPGRPKSAAPPSRSRSSDRPKSAAAARETGWNPCFHHVVLGNKPLASDPYGQLPPARPETSRPDGVPANLRPGTRQAARTAKFIVRRRRERKRKAAAEAAARMEADTRTWEASFAYPRSDAANRKAPRKQAPQTRPTTAPAQRPTVDVARPATATSPASPQPAARPADAAKRPAAAKSRLGASPAYLGRSPIRVAVSPKKPQSTRVDPLARQLRTGEHLASKTYRARPAKPPRFGPKVHAALAEELYKTI